MIALLLCGIAFATTYLMGRRSLVHGLAATLCWGYAYGILRANVPSAFSHFVFDAALVGLYATQLFKPISAWDRVRTQPLRIWVALLIGWPLFLLLIPTQDPLVQLVGLRAHIFFLPFLMLGARLEREQLYRIALVVAGLNLVAFGFAVAEFFMGVPRFYPENEVTAILYRSNDIRTAGSLTGAFRIPATFANSAQYGSTMVITLPLLLLGWLQKGPLPHRVLFLLGLMVSVLGVFFSATRTNMLMLGILILASLVVGGMGAIGRVVWAVAVGAAGWLISTDERLWSRLMQLDLQTVVERFTWSMNMGVVDRMMRYPLGNGLGGGGSSVPYFLAGLIRNPMWVENQYATIMLEQGLPGLMLWVGFIGWLLFHRAVLREKTWRVGRTLVWIACGAFYATGLIGQGIFTAVPTTPLLFLLSGWLATLESEPAQEYEPLDFSAPRTHVHA